MKVDYSQAKIYKITNDHNNDVYVGSTCDTLTKRFSGHKNSLNCMNRNLSSLYKLMNELGFERFRIQLIENYPCEDIYQLRQREGFYIRQIGTLNMRLAGITPEETKINKLINEKKRQQVKKEEIKQKNKMHYELNKEILTQQAKDNYYKNKEKILSRIKEKVLCDCGCEIAKGNLSDHKRTKKHIDLMNNINI